MKELRPELQGFLKKSGFSKADSTIHPRLVCCISGLEKRGKTHFALSAPDPICLFNLDIGIEGVIHKVAHKEVLVYDIDVPNANSPTADKEAEVAWKAFLENYADVMANKSIKTVIIDTATELWEVARLATFGKLSEIPPQFYATVNRAFRKFIKDAYSTRPLKNLIILQKMKEVWQNKKWTGEFAPDGFSGMPGIVQVNAVVDRALRTMMLGGVTEAQAGDFYMHVVTSRHNPAAADTYLVGELMSFPFLASTIIEGTTPDIFM